MQFDNYTKNNEFRSRHLNFDIQVGLRRLHYGVENMKNIYSLYGYYFHHYKHCISVLATRIYSKIDCLSLSSYWDA